MTNTLDQFKLDNMVCVITGGAGLLGKKHAEAVLDAGGTPILLDIDEERIKQAMDNLKDVYHKDVGGIKVDITDKKSLLLAKNEILDKYKRIDVLINNASNNPKVEGASSANWSHFEAFPEKIWAQDINVGLTGAFLCAQVFGEYMAENKSGNILNISSDLAIIAPDQRIYRRSGVNDDEQMVKPVTYSVIKHALIGLTRYLATYWADKGVRVNAICPGGVYNNQNEEFVKKLTNLIPLGRMAKQDEYKAAVLFMISNASSYMTGSVVIVDGGRTCW